VVAFSKNENSCFSLKIENSNLGFQAVSKMIALLTHPSIIQKIIVYQQWFAGKYFSKQ